MRPNENCVAMITDSIIAVSSTMIEPVRLRYSASASPSPAPTVPPASNVLAASSVLPSTRLKNALAQMSSSSAAEGLRVGGVRRLAPEVVPADDADGRRQEVGAVAEELKRELGEEGADAADEVRGRDAAPPVVKNQTGSVGS